MYRQGKGTARVEETELSVWRTERNTQYTRGWAQEDSLISRRGSQSTAQ